MDLYKHAFRLWPLIGSDLVADCFELAWDVRIVDMRAAPYDLADLGLEPVPDRDARGQAGVRRAPARLRRRGDAAAGSTDRGVRAAAPRRRRRCIVISLRDATADDAEQVARIYVDSWNSGFAGHLPARDLTQREVARWRDDLADAPVRWRVAVDSGEVVGFAGTGPCRDPVDPALGELDTIAVSPACWRQGVGRALMDDALDALRAAPFGAAVLWTLADYARGDAFYRSTGWRPDGRSRDSGRQVSYRHLADELGNSRTTACSRD